MQTFITFQEFMVYYKSGPLLTSNLLTVYQSVCLVRHLSLATSGRTVSPMPNLLDSRAVNLCTAPWPLKHNTPRKPFKCYVAEICCQKNVSESGLSLLFLHLRHIWWKFLQKQKLLIWGVPYPPHLRKKICNRVFEGLPYICRVYNTYFHKKLQT